MSSRDHIRRTLNDSGNKDSRSHILPRKLGRAGWATFCEFVEVYLEQNRPIAIVQLRDLIAQELGLDQSTCHPNTVRTWIQRAAQNDGKIPQPRITWDEPPN